MAGIRYPELLSRLSEMGVWLRDLGIEPKNDRLHAATEVVRQAQLAWERRQQTGAIPTSGEIDNYLFGLTEAWEFSRIYEAFRDEPRDRIVPRLRRAFSGPWRLKDETKRNNDGRNIGFELTFGADWRLHGLNVELEEPDLVLRARGLTFHTACKRPFSVDGIRASLRAAKDQIEYKLEPRQENTFGLIVVSMSRIFNPGDKLLYADTMADQSKLGDELHKLLGETNDRYRNVKFAPSVAGVVFHVSTPCDVGNGEQLALMSSSNCYQTGDISVFKALNETMSLLYPEHGP